MAVDCPVPDCSGRVRTKRLETAHATALWCDGPSEHSDSTIRNAFARWDAELDAVDPEFADSLLRKVDPIEFLRDQVLDVVNRSSGGIRPLRLDETVPPPEFPTGLGGVQSGTMLACRGMTLYSGKASSGKTWAALRASLDAARSGWDVTYLAAEGGAVVHSRAQEVARTIGGIPDAWTLRNVHYGTAFDDLVAAMGEAIRSERTLFVVDSFSTLLRMTEDDQTDYWSHHRRFERLLYLIRERTAGCVGLLVLSEANAAGETKGRSFDHLADMSVNFASHEEDPQTKRVRVVKSWWSRLGEVGSYLVKPGQGGLIRIPDEGIATAYQGGYDAAAGSDTQW